MDKNGAQHFFVIKLKEENINVTDIKNDGNKFFMTIDRSKNERQTILQNLQKNIINSIYEPNKDSTAGRLKIDNKYYLILKSNKYEPEAHEDAFVDGVNKWIHEKAGSEFVIITIKNKKYRIFSATKTKEKDGNYRKSDISLVGHEITSTEDPLKENKEVIFISHKKGSNETDFQQWSGLTASAGPGINNHKEIENFVVGIYNKITQDSSYERFFDIKRSTSSEIIVTIKQGIHPFYTPIKDRMLKNKVVYGYKYDGTDKYGVHNCTVLIQGEVKFVEKSPSSYILTSTSNIVHFNGDELTGGYEPYLWAYYSKDRHIEVPYNGKTLKFSNMRFSAAPKNFKALDHKGKI